MGRSSINTAVGVPVGTLTVRNPIEGGTLNHEVSASYCHPLELLKIGGGIASLPADLPNDGTGIPGTVGTATMVLSAVPLANGEEYVDLLVAITQGPGIGVVRKITAFDTGTRTATVNRNWTADGDALPDGTSRFVLLLDTFQRAKVHVGAEYADAATSVDAIVRLYSVPKSGQAPRPIRDDRVPLENQGDTTACVHAGYYGSRSHTTDSRGGLGAKVRLVGYTPGSTGVGAVDVLAGVA
jgi:hypothetical protein